MAVGGLTTGLYLASAGLALFLPPGIETEPAGPLDPISLHKDLMWLHGAGMAATFVMGILTYVGYPSDQTLLHGILGGTTTGLMALSAGVIALDF
jgi:hypothetical protein